MLDIETEEQKRLKMLQRLLGQQGVVTAGSGDPGAADAAVGAPLGLRRLAAPTPGRPGFGVPLTEIRSQAPAAAAAEAELTGSRKTLAEINELKKNGVPEEKGFWRRLGSGALKGLRSYAEAGPAARQLGIGGLIGAIGGGAISSAASPKMHAEWSKERKLGQLLGRYGDDMAVEGAEEKARQGQLKTATDALEMQTKGVDLRHKAGADYYNAALLKGHLADDEIAKLENKYGWDLPAVVDKGEFEERSVNGELWTRRKGSPKWMKNTSFPTDTRNVPMSAEIPGIGKVEGLLGREVVGYQARVQEGNIQRETAAQRETRQAAERAAAEQRKTQRTVGTAEDKLKGAREKLQSQLRNYDLAPTDAKRVEIGRDISATRGIIAEMESAVQRAAAEKTKGVKPGKATKLTEAEVRRQQAAKNRTPEQIEMFVQEARKQGLIR